VLTGLEWNAWWIDPFGVSETCDVVSTAVIGGGAAIARQHSSKTRVEILFD